MGSERDTTISRGHIGRGTGRDSLFKASGGFTEH